MLTEKDKVDILEFAGSRLLMKEHERFIVKEKVDGLLYRGFQYPTEWLKKGNVVAEWNGSSHWSLHEEVAKRFSNEINDDFAYEVSQNDDPEISNVHFVPTIFILNGYDNYIPLHSLLLEIGTKTEFSEYKNEHSFALDFSEEKEVTFVDYDFVITEVLESVDGVNYCHVSQIKKKSKINKNIMSDGYSMSYF